VAPQQRVELLGQLRVSSLACLRRLPVNELKIDKSFVMAMEREEGDAKIVRSTIDLAHNLGPTVVAEGVENRVILEQLQQLHCDETQGYHLSKPLPVAEFQDWLPRWAAERQAPPETTTAAEGQPLH
jgi:EAL domain-containing protein (putative c-di-GMP-specific phosphodiesterase class I)